MTAKLIGRILWNPPITHPWEHFSRAGPRHVEERLPGIARCWRDLRSRLHVQRQGSDDGFYMNYVPNIVCDYAEWRCIPGWDGSKTCK